jgi:hypothetical protein
MVTGRTSALVSMAVALLLAAAPAAAQTSTVFADLALLVNVGDRVRVVDRDGLRLEGRVRSLSPDSLVIVGPTGPREFTADTTARIERRGDPVWTGALIGFIPGYAMGAQFVVGFSDHEEPLSTYVLAGGLFGLAGAGIGALFDVLHEGSKEVFIAEPRPPRVSVAPVVTRDRIGAFATMRW